jgi:hypothetical protein
MPAATVCAATWTRSQAGSARMRRGSGLAWTLRWQAFLGLLLCTVLLAWWGYYHGRGPGIGWTDG